MTGPMQKLVDQAQQWVVTRWVFLRLMGVIHLMAFGSYATQILGLNGSHGVISTKSFLDAVNLQVGPERYYLFPTLAWFNSSDVFIQGMANMGVVLSILVILGVCTGPALVLLMVLWLSLVAGGGEFTGFQSDGMLVEATLLSLFVAPWSLFEPPWPVKKRWRAQSPPHWAGIWLLRLMIFRFMFASGLVKILSHDPTWADFTALHYHFETQPLPTPLGWYAHQLSMPMLKLLVAGMFASELVAPFLMFGTAWMRYLGCLMICGLQVGIILTGNYTFLNYLTIVLAVSMLDDRFFERLLPKALVGNIQSTQDEPRRARVLPWLAAPMFVLALTAMLATVGVRLPLLYQLSTLADPLYIAGHYGVFAVMTTTRPEIIFEGSDDGKTWLPYELQNKPDDPRRAPPWVAPHMPRLSWRLWFAAMGPPGDSIWVISLIQSMLRNDPGVMCFFERNPFPDHPPKYIRAWTYNYHFTTPAQHAASGDWWWRDDKRVWLQPLMLGPDGKLVSAASFIAP